MLMITNELKSQRDWQNIPTDVIFKRYKSFVKQVIFTVLKVQGGY